MCHAPGATRPSPARLLTNNLVGAIIGLDLFVSTMRTAPTAPPPSHGEPASTRDEIRKLSSLVDISQALSGTLNLRAGLHRALEILERHHAVVFGLVLLTRGEGEEARAERIASGAKGRVRALEELGKRILDTGRGVVVPKVSQEPSLAVRPAERGQSEELSFVCVPITIDAPADRRAGRRAAVQGRSRLRPHVQVPRRRRVDDRAGGARCSG